MRASIRCEEVWERGGSRARQSREGHGPPHLHISPLMQVVEAFKILTADPQVKAILVNIFGECEEDRRLPVSYLTHPSVDGCPRRSP